MQGDAALNPMGVTSTVLSSLRDVYPWTDAALAAILILQSDGREMDNRRERGNFHFYLPTSEQNLLDNMRARVTLSELREWEQAALGIIEVSEQEPCYFTLSGGHLHPPPNATPYCRERADRHTRCLEVVDRRTAMELSGPVNSLAASLDGPLVVPRSLSVLDMFAMMQFMSLRIVELREVPLVSIHLDRSFEWPVDHILVEDDLPLVDLIGRDTVASLVARLTNGGLASVFTPKSHDFNSSSCGVVTGAIILQRRIYEGLETAYRTSGIAEHISKSIHDLKAKHVDDTDMLHLLKRLAGVFQRGEPPLMRAEVAHLPAYVRLVEEGVVKTLPSERVILSGDYADSAVIDRWVRQREEELRSITKAWLSSGASERQEPRGPGGEESSKKKHIDIRIYPPPAEDSLRILLGTSPDGPKE
jgi:hypothetical protein